MPPLLELQAMIAEAVTTGERESVTAKLVGGAMPGKRLDIHLRHYEESLTAALRDKYPACAWLAGADLVQAAIRAYVRAYPPRYPCIAEYGEDFPEFLARHGRASAMPYIESFARLEWAVGQVSIAIDYPPLSWQSVAQVDALRLVDFALDLQPGLCYVRSAWSIDELMILYLGGTEPEQFVLSEAESCIEIRGARGAVRLQRLDVATAAFRMALAVGQSIGTAAGDALDCDCTFDTGEALKSLVASGLAVSTLVAAPENFA